MIDVKIIPNTKEWDRVIGKYIALSGKLPADVVNKNCRDVGLNAIKYTKFVSRDEIKNDLEQPSKVNPKTDVATILASKEGLTPEAFKRKRMNSANYVRAGWFNGKKKFDPLVKGSGGFTPRLRTSSKLGDGQPATPSNNHTATAVIWNNVGKGNQEITSVEEVGLTKAVAVVQADRNVYVERNLEEIASGAGFK